MATRRLLTKKGYLLLISLALAIAATVNSLYWFLPYVWEALAIGLAGGVIAVYLLAIKNKARVLTVARVYLAVLVVVGVLLAVVVLKPIAPNLSQGEVKSIARGYLGGSTYVTSAKYEGKGVWRVNFLHPRAGWRYIEFDEGTGKFGRMHAPTSSPAEVEAILEKIRRIREARQTPTLTPRVPVSPKLTEEEWYRQYRELQPAGTR